MPRDKFAGPVIAALNELQRTAPHESVERALLFLRSCLTDAAVEGCHHCGEGEEPGSPCWWCGLHNKRRPVDGREGR
jgi:hypothetical protein